MVVFLDAQPVVINSGAAQMVDQGMFFQSQNGF